MKKIFLTVTVLILVAISLISITACKDDFSEKDMHGYSAKEAVVKESDDLVIVENVDDMIVTEAWYFTSGMPNNAITAKYYGEEGANVIFTFSTDNGILRNKNGEGRTLDVGADETLYWSPDEDTAEAQGTEIKIILKIGDRIAGCALLKVSAKSAVDYTAEVVKTAVFPKINGAYQKVTLAQTEALFELSE